MTGAVALRILAVVMVAAMGLSLVACSSTTTATTGDGSLPSQRALLSASGDQQVDFLIR